jgi:hypothetical protein
MNRLFAVIRARGPRFDHTRALEQQEGWLAHAVFMNALDREGFVVLGGPLEASGDTLLVFHAADEAEIRRRLAAEPWSKDMLVLVRIEPRQLRLGE